MLKNGSTSGPSHILPSLELPPYKTLSYVNEIKAEPDSRQSTVGSQLIQIVLVCTSKAFLTQRFLGEFTKGGELLAVEVSWNA